MRLDLYGFDGAPLHPMYLVYRPPQMLPTQTLNPVVTVTPTHNKRSLVARETGSPFGTLHPARKPHKLAEVLSADLWWWFGLFMTGTGGLLFLLF